MKPRLIPPLPAPIKTLSEELIVDTFAGGGGASTGIEQVRMCGNSVPPVMPKTLVAANLANTSLLRRRAA
jgi:hypothetical protein